MESPNAIDFSYEKPDLRLTPHEKAPLFAGDDAQEITRQLIRELQSGNMSVNDEVRVFLRQLGYVNLWSFLTMMSMGGAPYDKLTDHLHLEMANFYQDSTYPGAKAACFIGRSHYKSSVFTHGGNTWDLIRDPNTSIGLACGLEDRSLEFLGYSIDVISDNDVFKWLYPEHYIENFSAQQGCNRNMLTLPTKTRNKRQPNIKTMTAGGSTAGIHVDILKLDDIISDRDLNSERTSSASMYSMGNWLKSSIRTLVKDWRESRVFLSGTRYAPDDAYEPVMLNCKNQVGYWEELPDHYREIEGGEWDVYYRMIRERGRIIFPEAFTERGLKKLELEDPWTYWTQYVNNPFKSSFQELNSFTLNECQLDYDDGLGHSVIFFTAGEEHRWYLKDCDVLQVCDPAASEKGRSAQTSRSAHLITVQAPDERIFVIGGHADYVPPSKIADWLFQGFEAYKNYMRVSGMEMQGPFKVFHPIMREEQDRRRKYINFQPIKTSGDKDSRIRTQLEPYLRRGLLYSVPSFRDDIHSELKVFPDSPKKDIVDALSMAIAEHQLPDDPKIIRQRRWHEEISLSKGDKVTGY